MALDFSGVRQMQEAAKLADLIEERGLEYVTEGSASELIVNALRFFATHAGDVDT